MFSSYDVWNCYDCRDPLVYPTVMTPPSGKLLKVAAQGLAVLVVLKIVVVTLISYRDYMPPNFRAEFLEGRDSYFWQGYHWAFYPHIVSGPLSLVLGLLLVSDRFRLRFRNGHRRLGKLQVMNVLLVVSPSGLWMAWNSAFGPVAAVGFAGLAITTAFTVAMGWRTAVRRQFDAHRRWMWRCFVLLCSAVVIRVNGGLGQTLGVSAHGFYVQISWTSWLIPLVILEILFRVRRSAGPFVVPGRH